MLSNELSKLAKAHVESEGPSFLYNQEQYGPIPLNVFLEWIKNNPDQREVVLEQVQIKEFGKKQWKELYSLTAFKREREAKEEREAEHIDQTNLDQYEFYLLSNGQKVGPYNIGHLRVKLKNKELLVTDVISIDEGRTWQKIYQLHEFDRRRLRSKGQLPGAAPAPKAESSGQEQMAVAEEKTAIMTDLALMGQLGKGAPIDDKGPEETIFQAQDNSKSNGQKKLALAICSLLAVIILSGAFLFPDIERKHHQKKLQQASSREKRPPKKVSKKEKTIASTPQVKKASVSSPARRRSRPTPKVTREVIRPQQRRPTRNRPIARRQKRRTKKKRNAGSAAYNDYQNDAEDVFGDEEDDVRKSLDERFRSEGLDDEALLDEVDEIEGEFDEEGDLDEGDLDY